MDPVERNKDRRIPKDFLEHGHYYSGMCRNASVARWDATAQQFFHWREKFMAPASILFLCIHSTCETRRL